MWMYKEASIPPVHTEDYPLTLTQEQVDGWICDRILLRYDPVAYQGNAEFWIVEIAYGGNNYLYHLRMPGTLYGGVINLTEGIAYSFFDRLGNWLPKPQTLAFSWAVGKDKGTGYVKGPMPRIAKKGECRYFATSVAPPKTPVISNKIRMQVQFQSEEGDMDIVTGYIGEPHITAVQDRDANQGCYGVDSYILGTGRKLECEIVSAQEVRVRDGALSMQGCIGTISNGAYDSLTISNGTQGMKRSDLVVARYEKNSGTNVESISLVVIEGTPAASSPATPSYNEGNIRDGDSPVDFPLYQINIDGVAIDSVTTLAPVVKTQAELQEDVGKIGTYLTSTIDESKSVASGDTVNICSLALPAGVWVIIGCITYQNGGTANTYRCAYLGTNATANNIARAQAVATSANTSVLVAAIRTNTNDSTVYLNALQNSGSARTVLSGLSSTGIRAVRIA